MSKIFINLLFLEGGTNLIFPAGSKLLALSEGGRLPQPVILNACLRAAASLSVSAFNPNSHNLCTAASFSASAFNSNSCNSQTSFNSASLLRELLSWHCEHVELLHTGNRCSSHSNSNFYFKTSAVSVVGFSSTSSIMSFSTQWSSIKSRIWDLFS